MYQQKKKNCFYYFFILDELRFSLAGHTHITTVKTMNITNKKTFRSVNLVDLTLASLYLCQQKRQSHQANK